MKTQSPYGSHRKRVTNVPFFLHHVALLLSTSPHHSTVNTAKGKRRPFIFPCFLKVTSSSCTQSFSLSLVLRRKSHFYWFYLFVMQLPHCLKMGSSVTRGKNLKDRLLLVSLYMLVWLCFKMLALFSRFVFLGCILFFWVIVDVFCSVVAV